MKIQKPDIKTIKLGGTLVLFIAVALTAFVLAKKDRLDRKQVSVPTAYASEIPGWWYKDYFGASVCESDQCAPAADPDNDKLSNYQEYYYHSDPLKSDTNSNGLSDGEDVAHNYDPSRPGRVSFDEVSKDENILGESLLFNSDVNDIISESIDPTKVQLPKIDPNELNISYNNSKQSITTYLQETNKIIQKYFPNLENSLDPTTMTSSEIEQVRINSERASIDLKKLSVPSDALLLHEYYLALLQLLPKVVAVPDEASIKNENSVESNSWYDSAQAFSVILSKIDAENKKINSKY